VQVKRTLAWFAGLVGIAALGRFLAGRSRAKPVPAAPEPEAGDALTAPGDDPAEELRRRLAEARAETDAPEPIAERDESVDERRARVHAQAREAIDAMADDGGAS
jgi:hypothetical protein